MRPHSSSDFESRIVTTYFSGNYDSCLCDLKYLWSVAGPGNRIRVCLARTAEPRAASSMSNRTENVDALRNEIGIRKLLERAAIKLRQKAKTGTKLE
jgi:hypothetical protein